jgi:hypothetical protein
MKTENKSVILGKCLFNQNFLSCEKLEVSLVLFLEEKKRRMQLNNEKIAVFSETDNYCSFFCFFFFFFVYSEYRV